MQNPLERAAAGLRSPSSRGLLIFITMILAVGIGVRFHDLARHFSTTDDMGVARYILYETAPHDFFSIPRHWTYAPLQFIFTKLLISREQTYRDLLFYGRLPSFAAGVLALFALIWFYRRLEGRLSPRVLFPLTLMACSWEAIVHSKQMHNYELGVLAAILLLVLFLDFSRLRDISLKTGLAGALMLWGLSNAHYQILFFLPAFFLGALPVLREASGQEKRRRVFNFLSAGIFYLLLFSPVWYFFLRGHSSRGINHWNRGLSDEFVFKFTGNSLLEKAAHALEFFFYKFSLVLQSDTGFMPEDLFAFELVSLGLILLFAVGFAALLRSPQADRKNLGRFLWVSIITWFTLVMLQKIPLSPTRHSLILLPFFCVAIGEGADRIFGSFRAYPYLFSGFVIAVFLLFYPSGARERRDVFDEGEMSALVKKYDIQGIFTAEYSDPLDLMKQVNPHIKGLAPGTFPKTTAWISHSGPVDFLSILKIHKCCAGIPYELIYKKEIESDREVDFSKRTKDDEARNRIFIYVAEKRAGPGNT